MIDIFPKIWTLKFNKKENLLTKLYKTEHRGNDMRKKWININFLFLSLFSRSRNLKRIHEYKIYFWRFMTGKKRRLRKMFLRTKYTKILLFSIKVSSKCLWILFWKWKHSSHAIQYALCTFFAGSHSFIRE